MPQEPSVTVPASGSGRRDGDHIDNTHQRRDPLVWRMEVGEIARPIICPWCSLPAPHTKIDIRLVNRPRAVVVRGRAIPLTKTQLKVMRVLVRWYPMPIHTLVLYDEVWGEFHLHNRTNIINTTTRRLSDALAGSGLELVRREPFGNLVLKRPFDIAPLVIDHRSL